MIIDAFTISAVIVATAVIVTVIAVMRKQNQGQ